ncbi:putative ZZ type zinc finger domain-containing protein [Colletotrichum tofieldiae]|nr:putative ZZ type zinc finger domain-containing protein [Colletotrichum tofieldiae]
MIQDFFDFDEREYAVRISTYDADHLRSLFSYCCECNFDNYDLCIGCYKKDARCPGESHTLKPVQKAENPDFVPGISNDLYASTKVSPGT